MDMKQVEVTSLFAAAGALPFAVLATGLTFIVTRKATTALAAGITVGGVAFVTGSVALTVITESHKKEKAETKEQFIQQNCDSVL